MARKRTRAMGSKNARQRASADISRRKAKQKRMSVLRKRGIIAAGVVTVAYGAFGIWWLAANDSVSKAQAVTHAYLWGMTAKAGFEVKQVYLEGREHLGQEELRTALGMVQGDPILSLPLREMQERLKALPEVRNAEVRRKLPDALYVTIEERKPIALWQRAGEYAVIDRDGVVLNRKVADMPQGALLVVGNDAPKHMKGLMELLAAAPALAHEVEAAVRVGERRWNIRLKQGVTVMLPESDAKDAWTHFAGLADKERLLTKAIRTVDMRLEDRVFVTPVQQPDSPKVLTSARDT